MHSKTALLCLALASGLLAAPAMAGDLLHWQNNSLTYLYGQTTRSIPTPSRPSPSSTPAAGPGATCSSSSTTSGSTASAAATATPYGEFSPRLSLGKVSGRELSFGPIRDVLIGATYERGESSADGVPNQNYLLGPAVDRAARLRPLRPQLLLSQARRLHRARVRPVAGHPDLGHDLSGRQVRHPLRRLHRLGGQRCRLEVPRRLPLEEPAHRAADQVRPGKALDYAPGKLYVGIEYDYWSNKYGLEDGSLPFKTDQNTFSAIVKAHF